MNETKDVVIDDQNKNEVPKMTMADFNCLSIETNNNLCFAANRAILEIQGDGSFEQAINNELFCHLWPIQVFATGRMVKHDRKKLEYEKTDRLIELQKMLHQRLYMLYHYGECKGRELPGIKWHMEKNGVFAIDLKECALNLEHSIKDDKGEGTAITVWLNLPLLEKEDPEDDNSHLAGEYDEFVGFCCQMTDDRGNNPEYRDVYLDCHNWQHKELIRDTLAGLDMIGDMMNEQNENK